GLGIALGCLLLIHLLHNRGRGFGQRIDLGFDLCLVIALDRFFQIGKRLLDCGLLLLGGLVAGFGQGLAGGMHQLIAPVAHGQQLFELAVFLGVGSAIGSFDSSSSCHLSELALVAIHLCLAGCLSFPGTFTIASASRWSLT